ncbi:MAG TPA: hypothetical protein VFK72_07615 [Nevskia sp.]|nr:hypothetical protein [Nevskia sp.]
MKSNLLAATAASFMLFGASVAFASDTVTLSNPQLRMSGPDYIVSYRLTSTEPVIGDVYNRITLIDEKGDQVLTETTTFLVYPLRPSPGTMIIDPIPLPRDLSGTFKVRTDAVNGAGLLLASADLGSVTLKAESAPSASLSSCSVTNGDVLAGVCTVTGAVTPKMLVSMKVYRDASPVAYFEATSTVQKGTATFKFGALPGAGRYTAVAQIMDGDALVGLPRVSTVTLDGRTAHITSVTTDRADYGRGSAAHVAATVSSSGFGKGELFADASLAAGDASCGTSGQAEVTGDTLLLDVPVGAPCAAPTITVRLLDSKGAVVDSFSIHAFSGAAGKGSSNSMLAFVVVGAAILGIAASIRLLRRRRVPPAPSMPAF